MWEFWSAVVRHVMRLHSAPTPLHRRELQDKMNNGHSKSAFLKQWAGARSSVEEPLRKRITERCQSIQTAPAQWALLGDAIGNLALAGLPHRLPLPELPAMEARQ